MAEHGTLTVGLGYLCQVQLQLTIDCTRCTVHGSGTDPDDCGQIHYIIGIVCIDFIPF